MFLWQRADRGGHHWPLKETWQIAGWLSRSRRRDRTCQFRNFTTDSQFYWMKCKTHMTTCVPSKHPILCRPWRCSPAYNQSSYKFSRHIDGTELPPCVRIYWSVQTKWFFNTGENAYGREWKNLLCHLEQQVADKSWRAKSPLGYFNEHKILSSIHQHRCPHFRCDRNYCIFQGAISKCRHFFSNWLRNLSSRLSRTLLLATRSRSL